MPAFLSIGEEVAGYRVEAFIGRGGMAVVYRAQDLRLGRQVALKLLAPELSESERFRQRFMRESRLAASIDHPNIIPIYEAGEIDDLLYIAMRYVDGVDLKALLERSPRLAPERCLALLMPVASALDAAHQRGLVHRDVKPGNILVATGEHEDADHVYLTDFGLTKKSMSLTEFTTVGHFVGTVDYVAPEQIANKPVDGRTDIYALACVAYQALSGTLPFDREDDAAVLWAHLWDVPPPLTSHRPELPAEVDTVLARALAKSPEERFPTCRSFLEALRAALEAPQSAAHPLHPPAAGGSGDPVRAALPLAPPSQRESVGSAPGAARARPPDATEASPAPERPDADESGPESGPDSGPEPEPGQTSGPSSSPAAEAPPTPSRGARPSPSANRAPPRPASRSGARPASRSGARPAPRARPRPGTSGPIARRWLLVGGLAVLVLVAAALLWPRSGFTTYGGTSDGARFSFQYPSSWSLHTHDSYFLTASPVDLTRVFVGDGWGDAIAAARRDPSTLVGVYAKNRFSGFDQGDPANLVQEVGQDLPNSRLAATGTDSQVAIAGRTGTRIDGILSDPSGSGTSLQFRYYVVPVDSQGTTAHLMVFAAPQRFGAEKTKFDRIVGSLSLGAPPG